ncbi:helix-turn-helix domain-containing protein [Streptomyces sp. NPDC018693]|uniref:helix-turn-helix domain-containing protein n=1 Tax=unclassified Streptomyces TaxID=2593676 RepID=UPI0037BB8C3C
MRIHRTSPTRALSGFSHAFLDDPSISWCAAGVLLYLLRLPAGARISVRTLARDLKEGRARVVRALRELEESRHLRRVGQLPTSYEVFEVPYEAHPPTGDSEKLRLAERRAYAARLLGSLGIADRRLLLGASAVWRLAPMVVAWWDAGATDTQIRAALTSDLPPCVYSPATLVESRLRHGRPVRRAAAA